VDQLKGALTPEHIQEIAHALNLPPDSALAHLAEHLPVLRATRPENVDKSVGRQCFALPAGFAL